MTVLSLLGGFVVGVVASAIYVTFINPDAGYDLRGRVGL